MRHGGSSSILSHPAAAAAYYAAEFGWAVFPLTAGTKRPHGGAAPRGLHCATTDLDLIRSWWRRWPDCGVAIRTGAASGLVVIDVDKRTGGWDSLAELDARHGFDFDTARVWTPSGGAHFYYRHPGGLRCTASLLGPGVDTKAEGGYVVAPPSRHPNGGTYVWQRWLEGGVDVGAVHELGD